MVGIAIYIIMYMDGRKSVNYSKKPTHVATHITSP